MATTNNTNPWLGILPYSKDTNLKEHPFRGRDKETKDMYRLVTNNAITTLYGRSGVGKSSLLQAGLSPLLRKDSYCPILLRLHTECSEEYSFAQCIVKSLQHLAVLREGCDYEERCAEDVDYLWRFMAYHQFEENKNKVIPVLILDQFEEVLRSASDKATKLLRQLRATLNDGYLPNGKLYKIGFRVLISLREDDLYLLEDLLDKDSIDQLKQCRYRLRDVDVPNAMQIIDIRNGLFDKSEEKVCHEELLKQATKDEQISTLVLSLLCFRAYEKAKGNPIRLKDIANVSDTTKTNKKKKQYATVSALEDFYNEATKDLTDNEQRYLLDNSVTEDGRRKRIKGDVLKANIPNDFDLLTNENSQHHIFTIASGEKEKDTYYELIHDQIASVVQNKRQSWEAQLRTRRIKQLLITILSIAAFVILMCITVPVQMCSTIPLDPTELNPGDTLYAANKPYYVKGGKLDLDDNVYIEPGALFGIKNVHYIKTLGYNYLGHYFPEADTVDLEGNIGYLSNIDSLIRTFPNVKCLILGHSSTYENKCFRMPSLQSVVVKNKCFKWHRGTLFSWHEYDSAWYPIVTNNQSMDTISYIDTVFANHAVRNARAIRVFDLANPPKVRDSLDRYILTCSDSNLKSIGRTDIETIVDKEQIYEINFQYVTHIETRAFLGTKRLHRANLPNVLFIGNESFRWCSALQSISIPLAASIDFFAFSDCKQLQHIQAPMIHEIRSGAFFNCQSLQCVEMPNLTSIWPSAFEGCSALLKINLPKVTQIGECAFSGCINLQNIDFPNAESIDFGAFNGCSSLQEVNLPKATSIGKVSGNLDDFYLGTFAGCSSLKSIELPNVTEFLDDSTFSLCTSLQSIVLPKITKINVNTINNTRYTYSYNNSMRVYTPILDTLFITDSTLLGTNVTLLIPQNSVVYNPNNISYSFKIEKKKKVTIPAEALCKVSDTIYKQGFNICGGVLTITDTIVPYLHVPKSIHVIRGYEPGMTSVKHISISPFNKNIYTHKFGLLAFLNDSIVDYGYRLLHFPLSISCDRKRIILYHSIDIQTPSSKELVVVAGSSMDECREMFNYINNNEKLKQWIRPHDLLVPYGRYDIFASLESKPYIGKVVEMGWFETLWYWMIGRAELTNSPYLLMAIIIGAVTLTVFLSCWRRKRWIKSVKKLLFTSIGVFILLSMTLDLSFYHLSSWLTYLFVVFAFAVFLLTMHVVLKRRHHAHQTQKNIPQSSTILSKREVKRKK